jgi:hypothetical protein
MMKKLAKWISYILLPSILLVFGLIYYNGHRIAAHNRGAIEGSLTDISLLYQDNKNYVLFNSTQGITPLQDDSNSYIALMNSDGSIGSCYMLDKHYDGIGFDQEKKHIILFTLTDCMMIDENGTKNIKIENSIDPSIYDRTTTYDGSKIRIESKLDISKIPETGNSKALGYVISVDMRGISNLYPVGCISTQTTTKTN